MTGLSLNTLKTLIYMHLLKDTVLVLLVYRLKFALKYTVNLVCYALLVMA